MTDNLTTDKHPNIATKQPKKPLDDNTKMAQQASNPIQKAPIKMVDILIAGVTYDIYCSVDEEEELRSAASHINTSALNIRKEAPNLSQEKLLLLCCLNLYEKNHSSTATTDSNLSKQTSALLKKIIEDAQTIL